MVYIEMIGYSGGVVGSATIEEGVEKGNMSWEIRGRQEMCVRSVKNRGNGVSSCLTQ